MPYKIVKRAGKTPYKIINKETGKAAGSSISKAKAKSSIRVRMGAEHGWKPTRKKRK